MTGSLEQNINPESNSGASRHHQRLQVYERHLQRLDRGIAGLQAIDGRFFWLRLGSLVGGVILTYVVFQVFPQAHGFGAAVLSVAIFALVVFFHRRLDRMLLRFRTARRLAAAQAARMRLDWPGISRSAVEGLDEANLHHHPFATDLQILGTRSLHHLMDTTLSPGGSRLLANWLLTSVPDRKVILERQATVREIEPMIAFRSRLGLQGALLSKKAEESLDGDKLLLWLEPHSQLDRLFKVLLLQSGLAATNILLFWLDSIGRLPALWIASLSLYAVLYLVNYSILSDLFAQALHLNVTLERFRSLLIFLEKFPYQPGSRLRGIARVFCEGKKRPSQYLRRVAAIASGASLQNNVFVWLITNLVVPWDLFFAYLLERSKAELLRLMPAWLDAWYEIEALNSLANFSYLNPGNTYPELMELEPEKTPIFSAYQMGHPLIPIEPRVTNDFTVDHLGRLMIITGSNMSGKSTFLRTIGINLALTFAGTSVCASYLQTLPFRLFTSIQVTDSLSDGISYFYAEVRRLKSLLEALQNGETGERQPLFFLIDEIFRGTNNRERAIGSYSYIRALVGGYGAGIISTHDIELVHLEDEFSQVSNAHFKEEVEGRKMIFDYKLRQGPCPTTNALKIMELAGLPVVKK